MANSTQLTSGSTLQGGKYRIGKVLGQGGFGITYEAEQVALHRKVAIKEFFMKEYCNRDSATSQVSIGTSGSWELVEKFKAKFIKEAQLIAGLDHPNIIRIHDVFEEHGTAYYVMEYLGGGSLSSYVESKGRLSESEAVGFIRQVGSALSYIHGMSINHLDVKPGNILLDGKDRAVLIDFGLSKRYDDTGHQTSSTPVGISHGYAPLEQYKAGGVGTFSPTTDVYSLGATLYKLVTGQTPPDADVINDEGFPEWTIDISAPVRQAIEKAMQPRRKDRVQTVDAFLSMLTASSKNQSREESTTFDDAEVESTVIDSEAKQQHQAKQQSKSKSQPEPVRNDNPAPAPPKNPAKWLIPLFVIIGILIGGGAGLWWYQHRLPDDPKPEQDSEAVSSNPVSPSKSETAPSVPASNSAGSASSTASQSGTSSPAKPSSPSQSSSGQTTPARTTPSQPVVQKTKLYVTTNPSGATVLLDGKKIGVSPLNGTEVPQGNHTVKLTLEGYESYTTQRSFGDNPVVINENLKIPNAKLYVTTTPSGASVYVDGEKVGVTPLNGKELPQGSHSVKITIFGYEDYVRTFNFGTEPVVLNETLKVQSTRGTINGYEYVDLGLSVKWATKNVGASSPSDYGDYYAWGETSTKSEYWDSNSLTYEKNFSDIAGNPTYDVARKKWGSSWRLPRKSELEELEDRCTWVWTTQGGHKGYKVTGPNGNSIFLPAAGWRLGDSLNSAEEIGNYCSSSPDSSVSRYAYNLYFSTGGQDVYYDNRYYGRTVRPVSE